LAVARGSARVLILLQEIDYYGKKKKIIYRKNARRKRLAVESEEDGEEDSEDASGEDSDPYAEVDLSSEYPL
jgi:hypothetical protein